MKLDLLLWKTDASNSNHLNNMKIKCTIQPKMASTGHCSLALSSVIILSSLAEKPLEQFKFERYIPGGSKKTEQSIFLGLCSDQQLTSFTLLDRASFPYYNNQDHQIWLRTCYFMSNFLWTVIFGICHSFVINRASELWKSGKSRKWQSIRNYS